MPPIKKAVIVILEIKCTLCNSKLELFCNVSQLSYYQCTNCSSVLLDPIHYVSKEEEKERYEEHNNDVEDIRYQKFVSPIVNEIKCTFNTNHLGLDFGGGTGPVISKLLQDSSFNVKVYDPFFSKHYELLKKKYDYIICCEVIEHFHYPYKEFQLLKSLLEPAGRILCMTEIFSETIKFEKWYYKNDVTHVFFYHKNALEWIQAHFGFVKVEINGRLIQFW